MPEEKLKALYDATSQDFDLGTFEEFSVKMQDPEKRKAYYGTVGREYNLGTFEEFESKVAVDAAPGVLEALGQRIASPGVIESLSQNAPLLGQNPLTKYLILLADKVINILDAPLRAVIAALPDEVVEGEGESFTEAFAKGRSLDIPPAAAATTWNALQQLNLLPDLDLSPEAKAKVLGIGAEFGIDAVVTGKLIPKLLSLAGKLKPGQISKLGKAVSAADEAEIAKIIDDLPEAAQADARQVVDEALPKPPESPTIDAPAQAPDTPTAPKTAADEAVVAEKEIKQAPLSENGSPAGPEPSPQALGITPRPAPIVPKKARTRIREALQDSQIRVKQLQEAKGVKKAGKGADPYEAEIRFHGRVQTRLDEVEKTVDEIDKSIIETSKSLKISDTELNDEVSRYLIAKHAPEYNAQHGVKAAGITDDEAAQILADIDSLPYASQVKKIGKNIQDLNKRTLDILRDGEVIDDDLYTLLRDRYKDYVPFQRVLDDVPEDELVDVLTGGRGFSVAGSGIKRAKGSEREISDILANSMANVQEAIVRAEKNQVGLSTLNFARNNSGLGLFDEVKPKVIGTAGKGKPITNSHKLLRDKNILVVREKGKPVYLKINDPALANAIKATNRENLNTVERGVNAITKWVTQTATRFNPAFQVPNILRDSQEMVAFLMAEKNFGIRGALATTKRIPQSMKDVFDTVFRNLDTPGTRLYKQMQLDGGTTGGMALSTRQKVKVDIDKLRKINRSNPRKVAKQLTKFFDNYNAVFEDATRLSTYKEALARGLTREEAAVLAKEATINFNRKGTLGAQMNAWYAFANASVQGSTKMLKALKNPKVLGTITTSVFGAVLLQDQVNDAIDPDWRSKVPAWERNNNLVIVLPSDDGRFNRILIPVSWGIKPIKTMADYFVDIAMGHDRGNAQDVALGIAGAALDAYNPVGGSNLRQAITPTFLDVPADIWANEAWYGKPIKKESPFYPNVSEHKKYFQSLGETKSGRFAINTTEFLNDRYGISVSPASMKYAIEQMGGGTARFTTQVFNTALSVASPKEGDVNEIPLVNRFFKSTPEDVIERWEQSSRLDAPDLKRAQEASDNQGWDRTLKVRDAFNQYKAATTDAERERIRTDLLNHDPKAYKALKRRVMDDKRGITFELSVLKDLEPEFRVDQVLVRLQAASDKKAEYIRLRKAGVINPETNRLLKQKGLDKLLGEK